jgi:hypothetical protein|tara:strand:+ start:3617 stop:3829 length:213 start_codon:yes stop_codon:yes gene_type:complete
MNPSDEIVRQEAQKQAEAAFDGFIVWMKKGTLYSCLFLAVVVFGCNAGVEDDAYPAYNGEQYAPTNMGDK